jgi:MFS superfamily sulfate permease-like transporter
VFNIDKLTKYISSSSVMPHIKQIALDLEEVKELDATAGDRIAKCKHAHTSGGVEFEIQGLSENMQKKISALG